MAKAQTGFGSHLLHTAVFTSGWFHLIYSNQTAGDSTLCKNPPLIAHHLSCKARIIFISITKHSVSEDIGAVCWGPSWKIPQEVQSLVSSCNRILKFTSARTNCAGWKWNSQLPARNCMQHWAEHGMPRSYNQRIMEWTGLEGTLKTTES